MEEITCPFCDRKFVGLLRYNSLTKHCKTHGIKSSQELYDKIYKKVGDGICSNSACDNITKYLNLTQGYRKYCSPYCSANTPSTRLAARTTMLEKYGTPHNFSGKHGTRPCDITFKLKYNVDFVSEVPEIVSKRKETMMQTYGVDHNFKGIFGERQCDKTFREKYQYNSVFETPELKEKSKQTLIDKLGVDNYFKRRDLVELDWKRTLGVSNPLQDLEIYKKSQSNTSRRSYRIKYTKTIHGNDISYQSNLELDFINYCNETDIFLEDGDCISYIFKNKLHKYYIDFKIKINDQYQLIELKGLHKWFLNDMETGKHTAKMEAAISYSNQHNYLPFKFYLDDGNSKEYF